ncbi:MAG TPA: hypothetical protein VEA69_14545 [Tepidisphaeraceae bacterium]|nr:hypothetical protein [Tepidisphaeraceae bacterium]
MALDDPDGGDVQYTADFNLTYDLQRLFSPPDAPSSAGPTFELSFEGHLAANDNKDKKSQDALRLRLGTQVTRNWPAGNWLTSVYFSVNAKYEADSDLDTEALVLEAIVSPRIDAWGIGAAHTFEEIWQGLRRQPVARRTALAELGPPVEFQWRPFFGLDVGKTLDRPAPEAGDPPPPNDEILRLFVRVRAVLHLNGLASDLSLNAVQVYAEETFYYLPLGDEPDHTRNFFTTGVEFYFTPDVALTLSYKIGEDAPTFGRAESFSVGLGLKF